MPTAERKNRPRLNSAPSTRVREIRREHRDTRRRKGGALGPRHAAQERHRSWSQCASIHAHGVRLAWELHHRVGDPGDPVRTEVSLGRDDAGHRDAGGRRVHSGAAAFNWSSTTIRALPRWTASARRALATCWPRWMKARPHRRRARVERDQPQGGWRRGDPPQGRVGCAQRRHRGVVDDAGRHGEVRRTRSGVGRVGHRKSTLVRAIAGLLAVGRGRDRAQAWHQAFPDAAEAYIPLGTLRRATTYPRPSEDFDDNTLRDALKLVGLEHLHDRLDEEASWDRILGRRAAARSVVARLFLHQPDIVVMDEATRRSTRRAP